MLGIGLFVMAFALPEISRCCHADVIAYLTPTRQIAGQRFETDLMFIGPESMIGDRIELINLDIANSKIGQIPLSDYSRVRLNPAKVFESWHDGTQFGDSVGFESQVSLDAFADDTAGPVEITDSTSFLVGTLTFDYSNLGLRRGDSITLDLTGRDDGSNIRTTSVAIRPADESSTVLQDLDFSSPHGSAFAVHTITAIPEPTHALLSLLATSTMMLHRRRRSS